MLNSHPARAECTPYPFNMGGPTTPKEGSRRGRPGPFEKAGTVIKNYRLALKWSQEDLASAYGSTQGYISGVERGWQPITTASAEWYERMAAALKIDVRELMRALDVDFVISRSPEPLSVTPKNLPSEITPIDNLDTISYVRFITSAISIGGTGGDILNETDFYIPQELAESRLPSLRLGIVTHSHVDAVPNNVKVLFDCKMPILEGDTVVFKIDDVYYLGYYSELEQCVMTDRPISDNHPRRLALSAIHLEGVVENYQSIARPSRPKN